MTENLPEHSELQKVGNFTKNAGNHENWQNCKTDGHNSIRFYLFITHGSTG